MINRKSKILFILHFPPPEKGFVSLDLVASKKINEKLSLRIIGKNLLNPSR